MNEWDRATVAMNEFGRVADRTIDASLRRLVSDIRSYHWRPAVLSNGTGMGTEVVVIRRDGSQVSGVGAAKLEAIRDLERALDEGRTK